MTSPTPSPAAVRSALLADPTFVPLQVGVSVVEGRVEARLPIHGAGIILTLAPAPAAEQVDGAWEVSLRGTRYGLSSWVREMLLHDIKVVARPWGESSLVGSPVPPSTEHLVLAAIEAARLALGARRLEETANFPQEKFLPTYWWTGRSNFGDAVGPILARAYTGKRAVLVNRTGVQGRKLMSVGSIISILKWHNVDIWGSGLMFEPSEDTVKRLKGLKGIKVHAVRGKKTREALMRTVGWDVPEVYGDPALLLPRKFPAVLAPHNRPVVVPHYVHRDKFEQLSGNALLANVHDDLSTVTEQIAGASVVISSSLHGLIVAQAYGVKWLWLDIEDHQLTGGEFKFEDFFSCLHPDDVPARHVISMDDVARLDVQALAKLATLPRLDIDLDALERSFPFARARSVVPAPLLPEDPLNWLGGQDGTTSAPAPTQKSLASGRRDLRGVLRAVRSRAGRVVRSLRAK